MFVQDGFLYLILTKHKLTVQSRHCPLQTIHYFKNLTQVEVNGKEEIVKQR